MLFFSLFFWHLETHVPGDNISRNFEEIDIDWNSLNMSAIWEFPQAVWNIKSIVTSNDGSKVSDDEFGRKRK